MKYPFAKDISFRWYPFVDGQLVQASADNPSIYVFSDTNQPDITKARAGTGSAGAVITAWTLEQNGGYRFIIPGAYVNDPDQLSNVVERTYWVGITFTLKASGQQMTVVEPLELQRVFGQQSQVGVTPEEITAADPELTGYCDHETIQLNIYLAIEEIKARLATKGYEWAQIKNPERLKLCVQARVNSLLYSKQRQQDGDKFDRRAKDEFDIFKVLIDATQIEYDSTKDSIPDTKESTGGYTFGVR
jgi:hypothetical protein